MEPEACHGRTRIVRVGPLASGGVYTVYCGYYHTFYPKLIPSCPAYEDVVDSSFVTEALNGSSMSAPAAIPFATQQTAGAEVSGKSYSIEFATGSATISQASRASLVDIANTTGMTDLVITVRGHTDNTGDPDANVKLSRDRAQAVANALKAMAPTTFSANRFVSIEGYGDTKPVDPNADNNSPVNRAKNRRVEIVLNRAGQ